MKITTEGLQRFVGGQIEPQNTREGYIYRGEIAEIKVTEGKPFGDRPADECGNLEVRLHWMARMMKGKWVADGSVAYSASLITYGVSDIGDGRIFLSSPITGENVTLFPKGRSRLEPETVNGLRRVGDKWVFDTPPKKPKHPWKLMGYDAFEDAGEESFYPLDGEYVSETDAHEAAKRRLAELEQTQPAASSGGQAYRGIQDRVYIVDPDGNRTRFTI